MELAAAFGGNQPVKHIINAWGIVALALVLLTACGATGTDQGSTTSASSDPIIASFTRSGGLQGKTETLVIARDGTLTIREGDPNGPISKTAKAPPAQLDSLRATFASRDWRQLAASYGRQVPDGYAYTIRAGNKTITAYDGAQNPPTLDNIFSQMNKLWQLAAAGQSSNR